MKPSRLSTQSGLPRRTGPGASRGFTMIELMVTVLVVAILFSVGVPSMRYVTSANRISSEINGLLGDMQFARGEAIKEGQTVTVCVSTNGTGCTGGTNWNGGWIVFQDPNANKVVDAGEAVLRVQPTFTSNDTFVASGAVTSITFNREGFALALGASSLITLHDSTATAAYTRCLAISIVGQLAVYPVGSGTWGTCS